MQIDFIQRKCESNLFLIETRRCTGNRIIVHRQITMSEIDAQDIGHQNTELIDLH